MENTLTYQADAGRVDNIGNIIANWNGVDFRCVAKDFPKMKERATWALKDDHTAIARTVVGGSEGFESFTLKLYSSFKNDYGYFMAHAAQGTSAPLTLTGKHDDGKTYRITFPSVQILAPKPGGGDNDAASETELTFQITDGVTRDASGKLSELPFTVEEVDETAPTNL